MRRCHKPSGMLRRQALNSEIQLDFRPEGVALYKVTRSEDL